MIPGFLIKNQAAQTIWGKAQTCGKLFSFLNNFG